MSQAPMIRVQRLRPEGRLPEYMTAGAAGGDLFAAPPSPVTIPPGERALVPLGIAIELPAGYEGQIRPRSGLALREGLTLLNTPGTLDSDYRGEVCVLVINLGQKPCTVQAGDRIAQLVIAPVVRPAAIQWSESLSETRRGAGGFGHTGTQSK